MCDVGVVRCRRRMRGTERRTRRRGGARRPGPPGRRHLCMGHRENPPRGRHVHVMLCYSIYPPIQAGGAELVVSYLAEGLARRGHRVTVVSTCGPEMEPYPTENRNGVEVIRFFPKNRYWLFDREGRRGLDKLRWHIRDAWNRASGRRLRE